MFGCVGGGRSETGELSHTFSVGPRKLDAHVMLIQIAWQFLWFPLNTHWFQSHGSIEMMFHWKHEGNPSSVKCFFRVGSDQFFLTLVCLYLDEHHHHAAHSLQDLWNLSFFLGWWTPNSWLMTPETVPDRCPPTCTGGPAWVKTVYNVCGLACTLGRTSLNDQVTLTTQERSAWS